MAINRLVESHVISEAEMSDNHIPRTPEAFFASTNKLVNDLKSAAQAPCEPRLSSPGLSESLDSANGVSPIPEAASPDERDSLAQPVAADPLREAEMGDDLVMCLQLAAAIAGIAGDPRHRATLLQAASEIERLRNALNIANMRADQEAEAYDAMKRERDEARERTIEECAKVCTPENVRLGHTWLARQIRALARMERSEKT